MEGASFLVKRAAPLQRQPSSLWRGASFPTEESFLIYGGGPHFLRKEPSSMHLIHLTPIDDYMMLKFYFTKESQIKTKRYIKRRQAITVSFLTESTCFVHVLDTNSESMCAFIHYLLAIVTCSGVLRDMFSGLWCDILLESRDASWKCQKRRLHCSQKWLADKVSLM